MNTSSRIEKQLSVWDVFNQHHANKKFKRGNMQYDPKSMTGDNLSYGNYDDLLKKRYFWPFYCISSIKNRFHFEFKNKLKELYVDWSSLLEFNKNIIEEIDKIYVDSVYPDDKVFFEKESKNIKSQLNEFYIYEKIEDNEKYYKNIFVMINNIVNLRMGKPEFKRNRGNENYHILTYKYMNIGDRDFFKDISNTYENIIMKIEVDPIVNTVFPKNKFDFHAARYAISGVTAPTDECGLKLLYFSI